MKKGFALLEAVVVITFLSVSLLMLYGTFTNMISNSKKNILYDDVSNIYRLYYFKEYLSLYEFTPSLNSDVTNLTCSDLNFNDCNTLINALNINKIYLTKYDLKDYDRTKYDENFNSYVDTLSNKGEYEYRLIFEYKLDDTISYASLGL